MKLKVWCTGFAFLAVILLSSPVSANSLVSQGMTFEAPALDGNNRRLNNAGAPDSTAGNLHITATKALEVEKISYARGADTASTNTTADTISEPALYKMLGAGVGLLVFVASRRRAGLNV
jgi:PEP-CTERM motif